MLSKHGPIVGLVHGIFREKSKQIWVLAKVAVKLKNGFERLNWFIVVWLNAEAPLMKTRMSEMVMPIGLKTVKFS